MKRTLYFVLVLMLAVFAISCGQQEPVPSEPPEPAVSAPEPDPEAELENEPLIAEEKELPGLVMVSVDNHKNAYPQSDLDKADRVYELLAEGGITRYIACFESRSTDKAGPIRSARYYFAHIVNGEDGVFAHAGGNTDALNLIPSLGLKDMDEIYNAGGYFYRNSDRKMPHNLYADTSVLAEGAEKRNYEMTHLKALPQGEASGGEEAVLADIRFSASSSEKYYVSFEWTEEGLYRRYMRGIPHITEQGNEIMTENVIILEIPSRSVKKEEIQSEMDVTGSGDARFMTGGRYYAGTWSKDNSSDPFTYGYEGGEMLFEGGHAWVLIVPDLDYVTFM